MISTEADITGAVAKQLRLAAGLSQKEFWSSIGLTQSGGCRYETSGKIPRPYRILLCTMYVAGLKLDVSTPEAVQKLQHIAHSQETAITARRSERAATHLQSALTSISEAERNLAQAGQELTKA